MSICPRTTVRLVLARHAESGWNVEERYQGQADSGLTPRVRGQAEELGARLAESDGPVTLVLSIDSPEIAAAFPAVVRAAAPGDDVRRDGETFAELRRRVGAALGDGAAAADTHTVGRGQPTVCVFTHGGPPGGRGGRRWRRGPRTSGYGTVPDRVRNAGVRLSGTTFVAMTYNVWGDSYASEREPALRELFRVRPPDLLAVQELRAWSRDLIDDELGDHDRVHDDFGGWEREGNLWWRRDLFSAAEHGAADVGILAEDARLFWVRLRTRADPAAELLFSTAHLTWPGHPAEQADGVNRRASQAVAVTAELERLAGPYACLFAVDINDVGPPLWTLGNAGFLDSFSALNRQSPPTHPVQPLPHATGRGTVLSPLESPAKAIDWLFLRGPVAARASEVVEFFFAGNAPSDHRPVASTFTLLASPITVPSDPVSRTDLTRSPA